MTDESNSLEKFEKACKRATKKRETNRKLREEYRDNKRKRERVKKLLIEDILRVFNDPHNPYAGWSVSQKRYRQLGHFPELFVTDIFGTHAEFERAAGLQDSRGTKKVKNTTARLATEKLISEYANQHVLTHQGKWKKKLREKQGEKQIIVVSDLHSLLLDPFCWEVVKAVLKMVDPDLVVLNGDVVDFPKVGRFTDMPGATNLSLQDEIDFTRKEILAWVRKLCPDAPITWHIGNHEQRLIRYLADTKPALADLRCLQFDNLFGVEDYEIEMVFGGNFLAPEQKDRKENIRKTWKIYYDCFAVTHGISTAKNAMEQELSRFGMSGTSGHTHRPGMVTLPTLNCPTASWTSTGMCASFAVGQHYVQSPSSWTMGFSNFTVLPSKGIVVPQPILVYEDFATFCGHVWTPTPAAKKRRLEMWD